MYFIWVLFKPSGHVGSTLIYADSLFRFESNIRSSNSTCRLISLGRAWRPKWCHSKVDPIARNLAVCCSLRTLARPLRSAGRLDLLAPPGAPILGDLASHSWHYFNTNLIQKTLV